MTHATARAYAYQPPPWPLPHHHAARPWCSAAACRWRSSPPSTAWAKPGGTPEHPHSANAAAASPPHSPRATATLPGSPPTPLDSQYWRRAAATAVAAASGKGQGVAPRGGPRPLPPLNGGSRRPVFLPRQGRRVSNFLTSRSRPRNRTRGKTSTNATRERRARPFRKEGRRPRGVVVIGVVIAVIGVVIVVLANTRPPGREMTNTDHHRPSQQSQLPSQPSQPQSQQSQAFVMHHNH